MCFFVDPGIIPKNHPDFCPKHDKKEEAIEEEKVKNDVENKIEVIEMGENHDINKENNENVLNKKNFKENLKLDLNKVEDGKKQEMLIDKDNADHHKEEIEYKKSFEKDLNQSLEVSITIKANIPNIYK